MMPTPDEYVREMVMVFREVWRVLRSDGTCWVNLGDSYAGSGPCGSTISGDLSLKSCQRIRVTRSWSFGSKITTKGAIR
jgi:hypothetical protein